MDPEGTPAVRPDRRQRRRAVPARLVVAGAATYTASFVIAALAGNTPVIFEFVPLALIVAILAVAVWITGRLFVLALVAGLLLLLISASAVMELSHPDSFGDFAPALWRLVGAAAIVVGSVSGIVQRARRRAPAASSRQWRAAIAGASALVLVSALSFALSSMSRAPVTDARGAIVVVTDSDSFEPDTFELDSGDDVQFLVRNTDAYAHTFTIDELAVDTYVGPRSERLVDVELPSSRGAASRELVLSCAVTGHDDMVGTIRVG